MQMKQIREVLLDFRRPDISGVQHHTVRKIGTVIVPCLVDELEIRRNRIFHDPLIGETTDSNEMVIEKAVWELTTFAHHNEIVVKYLVSRLNDANVYRCVKLIAILEAVAINDLPSRPGLPMIRNALATAMKSKHREVVIAARQASERINIAVQRYETEPDAEANTVPIASLPKGHPAIGLFESAIRAASRVTETYSRDMIYARIAGALTACQEIPAARMIADRIADAYQRQDVLHEMAMKAASGGDAGQALELSAGDYRQADVLKRLVITLSRQKRNREIDAAIAHLPYEHLRDNVCETLAQDQLLRGNIDEALETFEHLKYSRDQHLLSLLSYTKTLNNTSAGQAVIRKAIAEAMSEKRRSTRAMQLIHIAEAARLSGLAEPGDLAFKQALAEAAAQTDTNDRNYLDIKIAYEAVSRGEYDIARRLANRIEHRLSKGDGRGAHGRARAAIAVIRIESGQTADAERQVILSLPSDVFMDEDLARLAQWDASRGDLNAAFEVVKKLREISIPTLADHQGAKAVVRIISERLRVGDYDGALAASTRWPDSIQGLPGMEMIIEHMIRNGKFDLTAEIAIRHARYTQKITDALVDAGALHEAFRSSTAIHSAPRAVNIRIGDRILPREWGDARGDILARIAIAALKRGQTGLVEQSLAQIRYPLTRGLLLCDLAVAARATDNSLIRASWIDEARKLVSSIALNASRVKLQGRIVKSLVAIGRYDEAAAFDRNAGDENVTRDHAIALAGAARYEQALALAKNIVRHDARAEAMIEMASVISEAPE